MMRSVYNAQPDCFRASAQGTVCCDFFFMSAALMNLTPS
jgi:hypothetical protein